MSCIFYIASDRPIPARPNPHDRLLSVNQALAAGETDIPNFMLAEGFDRDCPGMFLCSDREVVIDIDKGTIEDGDLDDDFGVFPLERAYDLRTEKPYCAQVEWRCTPGRAAQLADFIRMLLRDAPEVEVWHMWMDGEEGHRPRREFIAADELTAADLEALDGQNAAAEPLTDYCCVITR